jgi:hypothetical protein
MTNHALVTTQNVNTKEEESATTYENCDCFAELADLCNLPDYIDIPTTTTTTTTHTYDLDLENLPTFDFNNLDLSNIDLADLSKVDLSDLDLELDLSNIDSKSSTNDISTTTPVYEPTPLPEVETFKHKCGYCGEPAGWQHNTRHFIRLRSGSRYACFSCLCQRWRGQCIPHQSPGLNPKTRHRRLPRRRIFEQRDNKSIKHKQPKSKSS